MKLLITGNRKSYDFDYLSKIIDAFIEIHGNPDMIISYGTKEIKTLIAIYAEKRNIYLKEWDKSLYNQLIVEECTDCLAFVSRNTTIDVIKRMKLFHKPVYEIPIHS